LITVRLRPLLVAGCFCLALAGAVPARAEEAAPAPEAEEASFDTAEVQRLSDEAFKAFKDLEFTKARQRLEKALAIAREGQPQSNPVVAKLRLYLGMILFVGFHNTEGAAAQFRVARRLDAGVKPPPGLFNPEVEALFAKTVQEAAQPRTKPGTGAPATAPAAGSSAASDEAAVDASSSLAAATPPAPGAPIDGAPAADDEALPSESELLAGKPAAGAPAADAPPPAPPVAVPSPPVASPPTRRPYRRADVAERDDDDDDDDQVERPIFIALSLGSGMGVSNAPLDAPGVAPNRASGRFGFAGGGQLNLGVGYFVSRSFALALEGRLQFVPGTSAHCTGDSCDPTPALAAAGFARATYFFTDGAWRPFGSFGVGGGAIRQSVKLNGLNDCGADHAQACVTTATGGPLLGSLGAGIAYLSDVVMVQAGISANAGVPHLMLAVDLALGVGVRF